MSTFTSCFIEFPEHSHSVGSDFIEVGGTRDDGSTIGDPVVGGNLLVFDSVIVNL